MEVTPNTVLEKEKEADPHEQKPAGLDFRNITVWKSVKFWAVSLIILGFISLLALGLVSDPKLVPSPLVGKPAPDFTITSLDGKSSLTLSDLKGKPVILNFWASWCVPCRVEAPFLESAWRAYGDRGVVFIGVDIQDSERDALAYIREFDVTYPNGTDTKGRITVSYGVSGIPVTFFVDKKGIVVRRWVGALKHQQLIDWVNELLE